MRRIVLLTAVLILGTSLPASAKMPPFEMEVETSGDTVEVTVRINGDESLIHSFDSPHLNGLIAVLPAGQVDKQGRPLLVLGADRTDLQLSLVEPGTYKGSVTLEPGRWAVIPFPHTIGALRVNDAYPETVMIEVGDKANEIWALAALVSAMAFIWGLRQVRRM